MSPNLYSSAVAAFLSTCVLIMMMAPVARRVGLVDEPGGRKNHTGAVPLIGGLAMFIGFTFGLLMLDVSLSGLRTYFAGSFLLVLVGFFDDMKELGWKSRLLMQCVAALMMVMGGNVVTDLGEWAGAGVDDLGWFAIPFTFFATIGVINAINMLDGLDGLAGCLSLVAFAMMAGFAWSGNRPVAFPVLVLLVVCVVAFLLFNFKKSNNGSKVFMGDAGSMFLGYSLCWFAIGLTQGSVRVMHPMIAPWLLAVPLIDMSVVIVRRLLLGRSPFHADRGHLHHVLLSVGFSSVQVVSIIMLLAMICCFVGLMSWRYDVHEWVLPIGLFVLFAFHLLLTWCEWKIIRILFRRVTT